MKKINVKKGLLLGMAIGVSYTCWGCQLAKEEQSDSLLGDKLVGCYITTNALPDDKIYATLVEITEGSVTHGEYVFEGYDGIALYATTISATPEHEEYDIFCFGDEVCDRHNAWETDEKTGMNSETVSGTIYYTEKQTFYMNSVYQEKDGDVYMYKAEMGDLANGHGESTVSVSGTATYTENNQEIAEKTTATATFIYKQEPNKIKFLYMDKNNTLVKEETYEPGAVPTEIYVPSGTGYILVESYCYDSINNKDTIERELYSPDTTTIKTYVNNGKGFCVSIPTEVYWN